jgi:NAD+ synthase
MNRVNDFGELKEQIIKWLGNYVTENPSIKSFVVGVSGGIDSAVVSTLAASTGLPTYALGMPIHQKPEQENLSDSHLEWLQTNFSNVIVQKYDLTKLFETFKFTMREFGVDTHALANSRSRLRMVTLYQVAGSVGGLVVGTGNKVEDYGVGFYTKYGDGGVDIAPIADLYKTEVWKLGKFLGVDQRIINAQPTDGLWDDGRTDEDQLGVSYAELEEAMETGSGPGLDVLNKFRQINQHKMNPIPTFKL